MDTQQKQQLAERLSQANNILVTVSANPSVDQLAACIGLTLAMNKLGKHAAAVFSGQVPSTIEFLQPEKTLEKNTDSLRDFIIALDKSKADKLRYKVEDKVVKIFITPYKTSISEKDFEFSQGDFNVDVVVALGVHSQADIDQAITAHGRILHDATVATINTKPGGQLGAINWLNPTASSLSELVVQLLDVLNKKVIDGQMATALLTGIVSETVRFSNAKTSPQTMTISAELLGAGANQQLVATKLEPPKPAPPPPPPPAPVQVKPVPVAPVPAPAPPAPKMQAATKQSQTEGMLEIQHPDKPALGVSEDGLLTPQIDIDKEGTLRSMEEMRKENAAALAPPPVSPAAPAGPVSPAHTDSARHILQTPGGQAVPSPAGQQPASDPLSLPSPGEEDIERPSGAPPLPPPPNAFSDGPTHNFVAPPPPTPPPKLDMSAASAVPPSPAMLVPPFQPTTNGPDGRTLSQIEQDVGSPHVTQAAAVGNPQPSYTPGVSTLPTQNFPTTMPPIPPAGSPAPAASQTDVPGGPDLSSARDAVNQAINAQPDSARLEPITALNAMPLNLPLRDQPGSNPPAAPTGGGVVIGPAPGFPSVPPGTDTPPPGPPPMMPPAQ